MKNFKFFIKKKRARSISLILSVITATLLVTMVARAWDSPTCDPNSVDPATCNVDAPLNVGGDSQTKYGVLGLDAGSGDALRIRSGGDLRIYTGDNAGSAVLYVDSGGQLETPDNFYIGGTGGNVCHEIGGSWYSCPPSGDSLPSCSAGEIVEWDGSSWVCTVDDYEPNTDTQDLSISGHTISLTDGGSVTVPDDFNNGWDLYVNNSYQDRITEYEDLDLNSGTGVNVSYDGADDMTFSFDCSDVAGENLTCSGETLNASGGTGGDGDWLKSDGTTPTSVNDDIYTNGNIGVGGTPSSSYRILARSGASYGIRADGSTMGGYFYDSSGTSRVYLAYSSYGIYQNLGSRNYFAGDVGIGTTSPDGLQVNVSVSETSRGSDNVRLGLNSGTPRIIFEDGGYTQHEIDNYGGTMRFIRPGQISMIINSSGNVGIRKSTAAHALDVAGNGYMAGDFHVEGKAKIGLSGVQLPTQGKLLVYGGLEVGTGRLWETGAAPNSSYYDDNNFIAVRDRGTSEDFIGYKSNTFYFADMEPGGDGSHPNLVAAGFNTFSSRKFKEDISRLSDTEYEEILGKIDLLDVVHYRFKGTSEEELNLGVIVEDAPKEIVSSTNPDTISNSDFDAFITAGVKALIRENNELKERISDLEKRIEKLEE